MQREWKCPNDYQMWNLLQLKVGLDYSEEVHQSIDNLSPRQRFFEAMVGMVDKMENNLVFIHK